MKAHASVAFTFAALLSACGTGKSGGEYGNAVATSPSPKELLATINAAYSTNGLQARRDWGGKRVTVGGAFFSAGRNADGSTSVLVSPGDTPPTLGELNVGKKQDDFVAKLEKGNEVVMTCTVDPKTERFTTTFLDCVSVGV
ncbi:hypothetical protein [uncultured Sphingomonas sp.]|uniref:hypothetical protein n=1 Tax=uncultured Sphingomonas sp. TaxID=158754 RepID=UPI0025CDC2E3|nr:hypothetical protein [uncultured Sphingomonas sp.]